MHQRIKFSANSDMLKSIANYNRQKSMNYTRAVELQLILQNSPWVVFWTYLLMHLASIQTGSWPITFAIAWLSTIGNSSGMKFFAMPKAVVVHGMKPGELSKTHGIGQLQSLIHIFLNIFRIPMQCYNWFGSWAGLKKFETGPKFNGWNDAQHELAQLIRQSTHGSLIRYNPLTWPFDEMIRNLLEQMNVYHSLSDVNCFIEAYFQMSGTSNLYFWPSSMKDRLE